MSAAPSAKADSPPSLIAGQRLDRATFHERYAAMPPQTRAELIGGIVHMPSPLSVDHADENVPIVGWLDRYAVFTPGVRASINPTVLLDDGAEPQPDALLRVLHECGGLTRVEEGYIAGPPELVVEVARSSRRLDLGPKKADYERNGVTEYVVLELDPDRLHWFVLRDGRYEVLAPGDDGLYRSIAFPGLWLDPAALLGGDRLALWGALDRGLATPEHAQFADRLRMARGG